MVFVGQNVPKQCFEKCLDGRALSLQISDPAYVRRNNPQLRKKNVALLPDLNFDSNAVNLQMHQGIV
jgi:hypothetical protein